MFKVSTIFSDACITQSDNEWSESYKYTCILLDILSSTDESYNQYRIGILQATVHYFSVNSKERNLFCLNEESSVGRKPVYHGQSFGDQTADSNGHEHICHNVDLPHHVETKYGVRHVLA